MKVAGIRRSTPAGRRLRRRPGGGVEAVQLVDGHRGHVRVQAHPTDRFDDAVMFACRDTGRPRKRANSIAIIFGVAAGGTVMYMTGMSPPERGCRRWWITSIVLPNWVIAVVLPVRAGPDTISPHRP